jgi:hypothetical protein
MVAVLRRVIWVLDEAVLVNLAEDNVSMIYFIRDTGTGAIKIGYSKNPGKRLTGLQTATASKLEMIGTMQGGLEHEAEFQDRFEKYHLQGEWYKGDIFELLSNVVF